VSPERSEEAREIKGSKSNPYSRSFVPSFIRSFVLSKEASSEERDSTTARVECGDESAASRLRSIYDSEKRIYARVSIVL
jgi:hypothetical protein